MQPFNCMSTLHRNLSTVLCVALAVISSGCCSLSNSAADERSLRAAELKEILLRTENHEIEVSGDTVARRARALLDNYGVYSQIDESPWGFHASDVRISVSLRDYRFALAVLSLNGFINDLDLEEPPLNQAANQSAIQIWEIRTDRIPMAEAALLSIPGVSSCRIDSSWVERDRSARLNLSVSPGRTIMVGPEVVTVYLVVSQCLHNSSAAISELIRVCERLVRDSLLLGSADRCSVVVYADQ